MAAEELRGRVVCMAENNEQPKASANHEHVLGFKTGEGKVYKLTKTRFSEALFVDKRLHEKELLLKGNVSAGREVVRCVDDPLDQERRRPRPLLLLRNLRDRVGVTGHLRLLPDARGAGREAVEVSGRRRAPPPPTRVPGILTPLAVVHIVTKPTPLFAPWPMRDPAFVLH